MFKDVGLNIVHGMNRNAKQTLVQIVMLVAVFTTLMELGSGQVTFSNGWKPGKRSYDTGNCRLSSKSVRSICQLLLTELKQLAVCEARAVLRSLQPAEDTLSNQILFSGGR
ncbi:uncharacterized protein LOC107266338 isoform X2 [Cephus cinctus]|uniref:Uncharacterized protein LOC107266338 isoform X2 n=1 Tax=Cephus cinctus TaxID=211228 RepID=A0AAJ7VZV2_CEPCN|nr:uncharacterized protein LOC107266338 isoform X2 [Cephus cinctus]